jgi:hypothetical protein
LTRHRRIQGLSGGLVRRVSLFGFAVEVFAGEFPDDAGLAVFAVEVGAAAFHALLAHVHVELLAAKPLFKLGMFWTSHRF